MPSHGATESDRTERLRSAACHRPQTWRRPPPSATATAILPSSSASSGAISAAGSWRTGIVYVMWPIMNQGNEDGLSESFQFNESEDVDFEFSPTTLQTLLQGQVGSFNSLTGGKNLGANSVPVMAVDKSSASAETLFVTWADKPPGKTHPDIRMMKGVRDFTGSQVIWDTSNIITVNQDTGDNEQWFPWITWDECTDRLAVVFMDARAGQNVVDTYVAVSADHGASWEEVRVSDGTWSGINPSGTGYDYIGIVSGDGRAYSAWSDRRDGPMRPYVSSLLLWGVEQSSVDTTIVDHGDGTMTVTAMWTTNLSAFEEDRLTLVSPNQVQHVSTCDTCTVNGTSHEVSLTVPCEPGRWKYWVSSRRSQCMQGRSSDVDSFFVAPNLVLQGYWPYSAGNIHGCPAGDGPATYTVQLDFQGNCVAPAAADRMTLEALPVNPPNMAFFPQSVDQPADSAASVANGYSTTIRERQVGGCSADSADVYLDGVGVGKVYVALSPNVDLTGDGAVDSSDLSALASLLGHCDKDSLYNVCADFVGPEGCIDQSDLSAFATHLGHNQGNPQFKSGGSGATKLRLEPGSPAGTARVAVRLEGVQNRSVVGVVLRPAASRIAFTSWMPLPGYTGTTFAADTVDAQGPRVALLAFDVEPDASGNVELGTLSFQALATNVSLGDLQIEFEDVVARSAGIASTGSPSGEQAASAATILHPNHPNPFNPRTELRYTLGRDSRVHLAIFDIAGRRIRVLVDSEERAGEHSVTWDGRDATGSNVGSGLYFYRLSTDSTNETRKLVVLR